MNVYLLLTPGEELKKAQTTLVTTSLLGKVKVSAVSYENPDGSPLTVDADYSGKKRTGTGADGRSVSGPRRRPAPSQSLGAGRRPAKSSTDSRGALTLR